MAKRSEKKNSVRRKRHRSPAYPSISLEDAVAKAQELYKQEKLNEFDPVIALSHWGYEAESANGMRAVAALKQYGIVVESRDSNGGRSLNLCEGLAVDILLPEEDGGEDHLLAKQDAALRPKIFSEIWEKYRSGGLPSDRNLERYLIKEKAFNPNAVKPFIRIFRDTLEYSKLEECDKISDTSEENGSDERPAINQEAGKAVFKPASAINAWQSPSGNRAEKDQVKMRDLPVTLPSLNVAVVRVPTRMTTQDYDVLMASLEAWKPALVQEDSLIDDGSHLEEDSELE